MKFRWTYIVYILDLAELLRDSLAPIKPAPAAPAKNGSSIESALIGRLALLGSCGDL